MKSLAVAVGVSLFHALSASAQVWLYAVEGSGDLARVDPATGAAAPAGSVGFPVRTAGAYGEWILTAGGPTLDNAVYVNHWTATPQWIQTWTGRPAGYTPRSLAPTSGGVFVLLDAGDPGIVDLIAWIDYSSGAYHSVLPTDRTDLIGLAWSPWGAVLALGSDDDGKLYTLDLTTGATTIIGGSGLQGSTAIAFLPGIAGSILLAAGPMLSSVDPLTGEATPIGPTGLADIRGLVALGRHPCYADCKGCFSGTIYCSPPILNVSQFSCFLSKFAAGDPWANCDQSTTPPVLNVADFTCFLEAFAGGCQ
jgi:hypothetical protein